MNSTTEQLLNAVLALPDDDRLQMAEALIASLQPGDQPPFDDSWREVIRRRSMWHRHWWRNCNAIRQWIWCSTMRNGVSD